MENTIIRRAERKDHQALCSLYVEFHEFHALRLPDRLHSLGENDRIDRVQMIGNFEAIMADEDSVILIAENPHQPVGMAHVMVRQDESNPAVVSRKYAYLQSLLVLESYRGFRIGNQLLNSAEQWAKEKGAAEMRLGTWEFAESPLGFYESAGYRTLKRTLVKCLESDRHANGI